MSISDDSDYDPVVDFREQALIRHNLYRSKHQRTNPLSLDERLCEDATEWANYLGTWNFEYTSCRTRLTQNDLPKLACV